MIEYEWQPEIRSGYCGPASLAIALKAIGIEKSQQFLANLAHTDNDWGTDHQSMETTANNYGKARQTTEMGLDELSAIAKTNPVIVNFMDGDNHPEDGHYAILKEVTKDEVILVDPNYKDSERRIPRKEFEKHWWDVNKDEEIVKNWALIIL